MKTKVFWFRFLSLLVVIAMLGACTPAATQVRLQHQQSQPLKNPTRSL